MFRLGRLLSRFIDVLTVIAGLSIAFMMLHITADVVARVVFQSPLPGTMSLVSYYYMAVAAFMPLAFAEQKSAHISVEVLTERLPATVQKHLAGWLLLISAASFLALTVRTWGEAMTKWEIKASVVQGLDSIPVWPTYFVLPVGCALMFLVVVYKFLVYVSGAESGLDDERARADDLDGV
ncbi:TRAP transporter small permease [Xenophilus arseniciresistens]|uniref:TRAP transporter small permease protein n=1 Tax=Xenophilus arseniciresistens TaxID=1283306 RepID=A0AAE3SYG5_9BURK|nr:TRAP transporter small permease [Xenophilus arseniciresistens]MDA7416014.1 TRAP transporter small permease [Xenophilus arseniciresistens]